MSALDPEYAVIQCGYGNDYGHPHDSALNALKNYDNNIVLYRNDLHKDIILSIDVAGDMVWDIEVDDVIAANLWKSGNTLTGQGPIATGRNLDRFDIWNVIVEGYVMSYKKEMLV